VWSAVDVVVGPSVLSVLLRVVAGQPVGADTVLSTCLDNSGTHVSEPASGTVIPMLILVSVILVSALTYRRQIEFILLVFRHLVVDVLSFLSSRVVPCSCFT